MTCGPSIAFTPKAVFDKIFIRKLWNVFKSIVGTDASQLYPFSMCQQNCTRDGNLTLICRNSRLDIIELAILRICSCLSIRKQDHNSILRIFSDLENRRKLTVLIWTVIVHGKTVRHCSKHWDVTTTSVPVKKFAHLFQIRILNEVIRRERWMVCDENTLKRKYTKLKSIQDVGVRVVGKFQN